MTGRLSPLYHLALFCGLRRGELLALRWADLDLEAATLRVRASKTASGIRTIPLLPHLVERLHEHWHWLHEEYRIAGLDWTGQGLVFPTSVGTPITGRNLFRHFKSVLKQAGLPDVRFHDLRHTCATLLAAEEVPLVIAMRILGHSQMAITAEVYSHAQLDDMRAALGRVGKALLG